MGMPLDKPVPFLVHDPEPVHLDGVAFRRDADGYFRKALGRPDEAVIHCTSDSFAVIL
jgi:hypothetical protein